MPESVAARRKASFRSIADGRTITFGTQTRWSLPHRLSTVDVSKHILIYETAERGVPRILVFSTPYGQFGNWEFDAEKTVERNSELEEQQ